jgi:hypothetical protein
MVKRCLFILQEDIHIARSKVDKKSPYELGAKECQSLNLDALNAVTCLKNCFSTQMKQWT